MIGTICGWHVILAPEVPQSLRFGPSVIVVTPKEAVALFSGNREAMLDLLASRSKYEDGLAA
jgi:hypothetical protein